MQTTITYSPIGIIHTPFKKSSGMPIQPSGSGKTCGTIVLNEDLAEGLNDLERFSHIILIYHFHEVAGFKLNVVPFMDDKPHGIFATRAPSRPNAIGISTVKLKKTEGNVLYIEGVDMLDQTPLLDIKPFFPYDNRENVSFGWLQDQGDIDIEKIKSDNRFNDLES